VIAIGRIPPIRNTHGQPRLGITGTATQPTAAEPSENPQNIAVTANARVRWGMYSAVSAIALGIAPPMPNPVSSRNASSSFTELALAASSEPTPKISGQISSTGRRPTIRSASGPNTSAPTIMPINPYDSTGPSAGCAMWNCARSAGAT
jgi:hypothetical protein